jgi:hypothetical protein
MKKLLAALLILGYTPYLFLATSVGEIPNSNKRYSCVVGSIQHEKALIGFGSVSYMSNKHSNLRIILPFFNIDDDIFVANCGNKTIEIGSSDWIKVGEKINVDTEQSVVKFLGHTVYQEESIFSFSTDNSTVGEL